MRKLLALFVVLAICISTVVYAGTKIELKDPKGDDKGTGIYTYPTDPIYVKGSFDLTKCTIEDKGDKIEFKISFGAPVSFNWGDHWDVQMVQIYLDFDGKEGSGRTKSLPGTQVSIDPACGWEKLLFIDPHTVSKINGEIKLKADDMKNDIVLPDKVKPVGKSLKATISKKSLGVAQDVDITQWGYGILMLSATGFPASWSVLARRVNEYEGQHRFGGGSDGAGDPHVVDMLVDNADGSDDEAQIQYDMLKNYKSSMDPEETADDKLAVIKFVYPGKK